LNDRISEILNSVWCSHSAFRYLAVAELSEKRRSEVKLVAGASSGEWRRARVLNTLPGWVSLQFLAADNPVPWLRW
jgi:hypothetical protein